MKPLNKNRLLPAAVIAVVFFTLIASIAFFLRPPAGKTNLLVLGIAGKDYAGEDLTDTILFISTENRSGRTLVLSLPRDIWIPAWRTKLNSIYHYKGLNEAKKTVGEILDQKIDYGVIIDFSIFKKIIDFIDGVEINIERSFDDYKYPIAGKENELCNGDPEYKCRYEHLHFEAGWQEMNGETALKYIRSRYAEGEEGTDFSRSQRQQRLIQAIVKKITSPSFFLQPGKAWGLFKLVRANIQTDISGQDYFNFFKFGLRFKGKNLQTAVLNENLLINPKTNSQKYDNQWVLVPKSGDWQEVQNYLKSLLIE